MRHILFTLAVATFLAALGNFHTPYIAALAVAAWIRHDGRLTDPIW